jgi:hypothetical protein
LMSWALAMPALNVASDTAAAMASCLSFMKVSFGVDGSRRPPG